MAFQQQPGFHIDPVDGGELLLDRVATALAKAILSGEIAPGTRLSVPELARQLQVSRTPAREALIRLEHEGLVALIPRRGAVVLSADARDLEEIFQYREALEGMAARLATRQISPGELQELREEFESHAGAARAHDLSAHVAHDRRFHEIIASASGNSRIASELARVRLQLQVITRTASVEPGAVDDRIVAAHREILQAIASKDGRAAEAAARRHVRGILHFYSGLGLVRT